MLDIEKADILLTTLSPVHIKGSGREYGWGVVKVDTADSYAYVIDQTELINFLTKEGRASAFANAFSTPDNFGKQTLSGFLYDQKLLTHQNLKQISSAVTVSKPEKFFIRDAKEQVIIPGTSIKGALRTAVAYRVLWAEEKRDAKEFLSKNQAYVEQRLKRYQTLRTREDKERFRKIFAEERMKAIFGDEPHRDLFRAVKVSDAFPDKTLGMQTVKVVCINQAASAYYSKSKQPGNPNRDIQIPCECLPQGTRARFSITLDKNFLKQWSEEQQKPPPFSNMADLIEIARRFAKAQWDFESNLLDTVRSGVSLRQLRGFYRGKKDACLRLGWGTGLLGTTIDLLLGDLLRQEIRNMISDRHISGPSPKSRRVVVDRDIPSYPLGWVKLTDLRS